MNRKTRAGLLTQILAGFVFFFWLKAASFAITLSSDTYISRDDTNFDGLEIVVDSSSLTIDGVHSFSSLRILNGGQVTHAYTTNDLITNALSLTISNDCVVELGGVIDVSGRGYANGPGKGWVVTNTFRIGGGGGYGGCGALGRPGTNGCSYGSLTDPIDPGSGGGDGFGPGGYGGGVVDLVVGGTLRVDGKIIADGAAGLNPSAGGGSGGSIRLKVQAISGTGQITANGGPSEPDYPGGGGGGRIAIYYQSSDFTGTTSAYGGVGESCGGAGTILISSNANVVGKVIVDNGGQTGAGTPYSGASWLDLVISGDATLLGAMSTTARDLTIERGCLTWSNLVSDQRSISVLRNATVAVGGGIDLDGQGSPGTYDWYSYNGYGGSYGGTCGGGPHYSSWVRIIGYANSPKYPGEGGVGGYLSASFGGSGGGALSLSVGGCLSLDGTISADGLAGQGQQGGGGAGGGLLLSVGRLTGSGVVQARGGSGNRSGLGSGGGGGRIAIHYETNDFSGRVSAWGGTGTNPGGAGTIVWNCSRSESGIPAEILVDNGGLRTTAPTWLQNELPKATLTITGGASAGPGVQQLWFSSLLIRSNGWLITPDNASNQLINVEGNATVEPGGGILLEGLGLDVGGRADWVTGIGFYCSGAGHGGYGGDGYRGRNGYPYAVAGGAAYGSIAFPSECGTRGGRHNVETPGGEGGGAIALAVAGTLRVEGIISADGNKGIEAGAGGGSGGSLMLIVGELVGNGRISADGGYGEPPNGGGGGGGRIALRIATNAFTGILSAKGGLGGMAGGAGTICFVSGAPYPLSVSIIVRNSEVLGAITPLTNIGLYYTSKIFANLTVGSGATVTVTNFDDWLGYRRFGDVRIESNGCFVVSSSSTNFTMENLFVAPGGKVTSAGNPMRLELIVKGDALIESNAIVTFDGRGYKANDGPGPGVWRSNPGGGDAGGGGAHGGNGGDGAFKGSGGTNYDSAVEPILAGSGGGAQWRVTTGSEGGGAVKLNVGGRLTVNGEFKADGIAGTDLSAGGGAGGAIWVIASKFDGFGRLSANGGRGEGTYGGGGGGGRIAVYTKTNTFSGLIIASGGAGSSPGLGGTVLVPPTMYQISGVIRNANGTGVEGVVLSLPGIADPITTTAEGTYSALVTVGWHGSVVPSHPTDRTLVFIPRSREWNELSGSVSDQNFVCVGPDDLKVRVDPSDVGWNLKWFGIQGISYAVYYSTNLTDWVPYDEPKAGTNGWLSVPLSTRTDNGFFQFRATSAE